MSALRAPFPWFGGKRRVFVCSLADLFHADVPDAHIADVFAVMLVANQHTFQVLTKRPARMLAMLTSSVFHGEVLARATARSADAWLTWPLPNVWVGVTAETQEWADIRIPALLDTPAAVRFLSCEPLLGPIDLGMRVGCPDGAACHHHCRGGYCWRVDTCMPMSGYGRGQAHAGLWTFEDRRRCAGIDWVIAGGESGPGARPMHPDWARSLRDQCQAARVAFHFKQWGEWVPDGEGAQWQPDFDNCQLVKKPMREIWLPTPHVVMRRVGKRNAGRELDGRTWDEYPQDQT